MNNQAIVGIDVGGTKINIGKIKDGRILAEVCMTTNANGPEDAIISDIINGIKQVMSPDVVGIGIGVPGLVDEENGIVYDVLNIPSWKEVPLKKKIEAYTGKKVYISNDANCFVKGEKIFGKGEKYRNLVGITLGTGVGAGIIINNNLHTGILSAAGEFGGISYQKHNYEYYCGGKFFKNCHGISGKELHERALLGDSRAIKIFDEYGTHLGDLIKTVLLAVGPDAIILGGSVTKSFRFFQKAMMESLYKLPHKKIINQLVVEVSTIDKIAVLGAAALVYHQKESLSEKFLQNEKL